jgi:hypothetical protein
LFNGFGTNLNFSTTYHPKSDGKIERVMLKWVLDTERGR